MYVYVCLDHLKYVLYEESKIEKHFRVQISHSQIGWKIVTLDYL